MPRTVNDRSTNLIWIDLEMTGLSPEEDSISMIESTHDRYLRLSRSNVARYRSATAGTGAARVESSITSQ